MDNGHTEINSETENPEIQGGRKIRRGAGGGVQVQSAKSIIESEPQNHGRRSSDEGEGENCSLIGFLI